MEIVLEGCRSEPFSSYLKSLGIAILLYKKSQKVRCFWRDDKFVTDCDFSKEKILKYFLEEYEPTPVVSPWNGGSGFYPNDNKEGMEAIKKSNNPRFELYRTTIKLIEKWPEISRYSEIKNENKEKENRKSSEGNELKKQILRKARNTLNEETLKWVDAAALIDSEDEIRYPPILKSGGNEGRLDYSNTFMRALKITLLEPANRTKSEEFLRNSIFNEIASDFPVMHMGMFDPGHSGGYNQGNGIEQKEFPANPWDFILMIEGIMMWTSSIAKRYGVKNSYLHSPFTVSSSGQGEYEIWAPLWGRPSSLPEINWLFKEGRAELKSKNPRNGIQFAEAVSSLGVDRGIDQFKRFEMMKRRGESYVLRPSDTFYVRRVPEVDILVELNPLLGRLDTLIKKFKGNVPSRLLSARRRIDDSIIEVLRYRGANNIQKLLINIGQIEKILASMNLNDDSQDHNPISGMTYKWIEMSDDGSLEFRLALSLASISDTCGVGPLRANIERIDPRKPSKWANHGAQVSWTGSSFTERMVNTLYRRMIDSDRSECVSNPISGMFSVGVADVSSFIYGKVDESKIENLIYGLMLIDFRNTPEWFVDKMKRKWKGNVAAIIPPAYSILKLLFVPSGGIIFEGKSFKIRPEKSIIPLLKAGRVMEACEIARRRLISSDLSPVNISYPDSSNSERLAASLMFPINDLNLLINLVLS